MTWFVRVCMAVSAIAAGSSSVTFAQSFGAPDFAYGNAGFMGSRGVATATCGMRSSASWNSCGRVCGPWWRGGCGVPCSPCGGGFWFGFPGLGFGGCYGASRYSSFESVSVSVPNGGTASFFSGSLVPFVTGQAVIAGYGYPANWMPGYLVAPGGVFFSPYAMPAPPGVGPVFGPAAIFPFLGADAAPNRGAAVATRAARPMLPIVARPVGGAVRQRGMRLVEQGDRLLRDAAGDPARLRAALAAYRRAAAAVRDDPDTFVRQALAAVALGDEQAAAEAADRAIALDGRLAAARPRAAGPDVDPVFDGAPADGPAPLVSRGLAILELIGGDRAGDASARPLAELAARWSGRWAAAGQVAAR